MNASRWRACSSVAQLTLQALRLGSTAARLKLKGIDGGPHKRWSMWFNSTQRAEPYLGWNPSEVSRDGDVPARELSVQVLHGCRQLDRKSTRLNSSHANISY